MPPTKNERRLNNKLNLTHRADLIIKIDFQSYRNNH